MTYMIRFLNNFTYELESIFAVADSPSEAERLVLEEAAEDNKTGYVVSIYEVKKVK